MPERLRVPAGELWEMNIREQAEAEARDYEERRNRAYQTLRAEAQWNPNPGHFDYDPDTIPELEHRPDERQVPQAASQLATSASQSPISMDNSSEVIACLRLEISNQMHAIESLNANLDSEKFYVRQLQKERDEALNAQWHASEAEISTWRFKAANLDQLLAQQTQRVRQLEETVEEREQQAQALKHRLREIQRMNQELEDEARYKETQAARLEEQLEVERRWVERQQEHIEHNMPEQQVGSGKRSSGSIASKRLSKQERLKESRGYISVPKGSRRLILLAV